jgi:CRP-like cAMP-binding protein
MIDKFLMKLRARDDVSAEEERVLEDAIGKVVHYTPGTTFIPAGKELHHSTLLIEGFLGRYKDLRNGERQVSELHVPGDFADLHSFTLKYLDHNIMAMTACAIIEVPHEKIQAITEQHPHLARMLWFMTNIDAAIHREWVVSLGRRNALKRTAHLFCELQFRLGIVGLSQEDGYSLPFTQIDLAECLGLTSVHINRVLRELRERRLVEFRSGKVKILDLSELRRVAEFDPTYLYFNKQPR